MVSTLVFLLAFLTGPAPRLICSASAAEPMEQPVPCHSPLLTIDRTARQLRLIDSKGKVLMKSLVGVGSGKAMQKANMDDKVTPKGTFTVELILYEDAGYNAVSKHILDWYRSDKPALALLSTSQGLEQLLKNMNSLDFNGDGRPDRAYGKGYIGLDCPGGVCGPKLNRFKGVPYWFSIALHGTPHEAANIGKANSGGCVQLPEKVLSRIIQERILQIGDQVRIK